MEEASARKVQLANFLKSISHIFGKKYSTKGEQPD
ncbi:unnamed protein product [Rhodiola kirilowii]